MTLRFVNASILVLILLLSLTGGYGIIWTMPTWMYEAHRIFAWALILLIPWKTAISWRSLRRGFEPSFNRGIVPIVSMLLSGATVLVIVLGLMWAWRLGPRLLWLNQTVISWHWILALVVLLPFALHAWARWPRLKRADFLSRRGFLQIGALSLASLIGWWLGEAFATRQERPDAPRRASGSRLNGYLSGNDFPVTTGAGDGGAPIDPENWQLRVEGAVERPLTISYSQISARPQYSRVALIDCTVGWYSVQRWQGLRLPDLLSEAGADSKSWGVSLIARSGHSESLPRAELDQVLLATHVGGVPLAHRHGFPLRAVVPSRRGWFWVKWLAAIKVLDYPATI